MICTAPLLAKVRSAQNSLMSDVASLTHPTQVRDSSGGYNDTYGPASPLPVRLVRTAAAEQALIAGEVRNGRVTATAITPFGSAVAVRDRLTISGTPYEVVAIIPDATYASAHRALLVVI